MVRLPESVRHPDRLVQALAAIVVAGAALRFATLGLQSFEADEGVTVHLVGLPLGRMLSAIPHSESTPPLYYLVAWPWARIFGSGEAGLRSLSAVAGTLTIPVVYLAGRELVTRRAGLAAAALVATNPFLVWHAQQARAYALFVLFAAIALWLFAKALHDPSPGVLAAWATASAAALATHYFAAFLILPELLYLLTNPQRGLTPLGGLRVEANPQRGLTPLGGLRVGRALVGAAGGVVIVAGALAPLAVAQARHDAARALIEGSGSLADRLVAVPKQFLVGFDAPLEVAVTVVAGLLAALAFVWLLRARDDRRGAAIALGVGVAAVALPLALALAGADFLLTRNLIAAWPALVIVIAAGATTRAAGRPGLAAVTALGLIFLAVTIAVFADPRLQRDDWRGAAAALGRPSAPRAIVLSGQGVRDVPGAPPPDVLAHYAPGVAAVPAVGVHVREVDYVALADHEPGRPRTTPQARLPRPLPPSVTLIGRTTAETYAVVRYRFAAPVLIAARPITGLGGTPGMLLIQRP